MDYHSRMKKPSRSVLGCGGVCAALLLGLAAWFCWCLRDEPPPDDADLLLPAPPVLAPEANAYTYYSAATNLLVKDGKTALEYIAATTGLVGAADGPIHPADAALEARAFALLERSHDFLALVDHGIACEAYVPPAGLEISSEYGEVFQDIVVLHRLRLSVARCRRDWTSVSNDVASLLRYSRQLWNYGGVENAAGTAALFGLCAILDDVIRDPGLPPAFADFLASRLPPQKDVDEAALRAMRWRYMFTREMYQNIAHEDLTYVARRACIMRPFPASVLPDRFLFHPNATTRLRADLERRRLALCLMPVDRRPPPRARPSSWLERIRPDLPSWLSGMLPEPPEIEAPVIPPLPNGFGKQYVAEAEDFLATDPHILARDQLGARLGAIRAALACRRFKRDTGAWPKTLGELVPKYLDAVPADPYDGEPLRYDDAAGRIWSLMFEAEGSQYRSFRERQLTVRLPR